MSELGIISRPFHPLSSLLLNATTAAAAAAAWRCCCYRRRACTILHACSTIWMLNKQRLHATWRLDWAGVQQQRPRQQAENIRPLIIADCLSAILAWRRSFNLAHYLAVLGACFLSLCPKQLQQQQWQQRQWMQQQQQQQQQKHYSSRTAAILEASSSRSPDRGTIHSADSPAACQVNRCSQWWNLISSQSRLIRSAEPIHLGHSRRPTEALALGPDCSRTVQSKHCTTSARRCIFFSVNYCHQRGILRQAGQLPVHRSKSITPSRDCAAPPPRPAQGPATAVYVCMCVCVLIIPRHRLCALNFSVQQRRCTA